MNKPQSGILPESSPSALFTTLRINSAKDSQSTVRNACGVFPKLTAELAAAYPAAGLVSVVGIGMNGWKGIFQDDPPRHLHPFPAIQEEERIAPSTPADLFLHIRSHRRDLNFLLLKQVMTILAGAVEVVEDIEGFRYLDNRDLIGFVDGTENPAGDEREGVALVRDEDPSFAGGSYVHIQRYVHRLEKWEALPLPDQEKVIGRTKEDDKELEGAAKPPTAHISRVVIEEEGEELEILRHSMPYGNASQSGLYFVAYGRSPDPFEKMLRRMICRDEQGNFDHLLKFSQPVTGALFFAPSLDYLSRLKT